MKDPVVVLENALCSDVLKSEVVAELDGLSVYPGINAEAKSLPRLQVVVDTQLPAVGFEALPECREYVADLYLGFICGADDDVRPLFANQIGAVRALFEEPGHATLKSLLNKPADPDPDERTEKDLYFYHAAFQMARPDPIDEGNWQYLLHYQVQFLGTDGEPEAE